MDKALAKATALVENVETFMLAVLSGEYNLDFFILDEKSVKIKGKWWGMDDALLIAACCLNEEERKVILDDVKDILIRYLVEEMLMDKEFEDETSE